MTNEISALIDGEQAVDEAKAVLGKLRADGKLRRHCCEYRLIGEAMRGESLLSRDITASVMAAVRQEPAVLAPQPVRAALSHHPMLALAATAAGVAVVAWVAFGPQGVVAPRAGIEPVAIKRMPAMQGARLAQARPMVPAATPATASLQKSPPVRDVRDYALAHQERGGALVSVFAEPLAGRRNLPESDDFLLGNVNVHRRIVGDQVLVVAGDMPVAKLHLIGDGIATAQK